MTQVLTCMRGAGKAKAHGEVIEYIHQVHTHIMCSQRYGTKGCHNHSICIHTKTFKDDTYLRREHVIWGDEMKPLARLAAAVEIAGESDKANSHIFDAMVNQKINLADTDTLKKWLSEQTAFDGKKVLAAFEAPESQARAAQMEELTNKFQISGTPTVIVGSKYQVEFKDWQSGMTTIDQLVDKVREEQKKPQ